jgi:ankyrin repeat protein
MKKHLTCLLLCAAALSTGLPVRSQTAEQPKLSESQQKSLNEKLMWTLWFGPRGDCDVKAVRSLLQQGASPNARSWDGNTLTALMLAAEKGCADIVRLLLDSGADVNAKATVVIGVQGDVASGMTPLSQAAASEDVSIVKMLMEHGADIHALTGNAATVMAFATTNEIVQVFLDRGLDINARDKDGYTLLIRSSEGFHRPTIAFLLEHGADPNAKTKDGTTALKLAQKIGHPDDVELLRKAGAKE